MDEATQQKLEPRLIEHLQLSRSEGGEYVTQCLEEAHQLVTDYVGKGVTVPDSVLERAVIETAANLFWRREAQHGIATFGGGESDVQTVHISTDPLRIARPLLARYMPPVIA